MYHNARPTWWNLDLNSKFSVEASLTQDCLGKVGPHWPATDQSRHLERARDVQVSRQHSEYPSLTGVFRDRAVPASRCTWRSVSRSWAGMSSSRMRTGGLVHLEMTSSRCLGPGTVEGIVAREAELLIIRVEEGVRRVPGAERFTHSFCQVRHHNCPRLNWGFSGFRRSHQRRRKSRDNKGGGVNISDAPWITAYGDFGLVNTKLW